MGGTSVAESESSFDPETAPWDMSIWMGFDISDDDTAASSVLKKARRSSTMVKTESSFDHGHTTSRSTSTKTKSKSTSSTWFFLQHMHKCGCCGDGIERVTTSDTCDSCQYPLCPQCLCEADHQQLDCRLQRVAVKAMWQQKKRQHTAAAGVR